MKLTLHRHRITDIHLENRTRLDGTVLHVNADELRGLLLEDVRLQGVDLEVIHPGENCRAAPVFDIIEPRAKEPGSSPDFPGILYPPLTAGMGTTRVLEGAGVTVLNEKALAAAEGRIGRVLEMSGPAGENSVYSSLHHLVVAPHARSELPDHTKLLAVRSAGMKTAVYLAQTAMGREPAESETFDGVGPWIKGREGLPRVAYVGQIYSRQRSPEVDEQVVYGANTDGMMPLLLHPNEWLDGAIVPSYVLSLGGQETYFYQNHPIITDLYQRHRAEELNFVGTVATIAASNDEDRHRNCQASAHLVKWSLNPDGAILTKYGGGAPHSDMAITADLLEAQGIRTAVMVSDVSRDRRVESALLFNFQNVNAIVYCGGMDTAWTVPQAERIVAGHTDLRDDLAKSQKITASNFVGVLNQQGATRLRAVMY